jgi:enoyl-CoA hydratase/carnithine racemase
MSGQISFAIEGHVARLILNRAEKLNAITPEMLEAIDIHVRSLDSSTDARVLVIQGDGNRAFSVGADIGVWSGLEPIDMWRSWVRRGSAVFDNLARLRIPTIAALNGFTFGGGLELALACDLRVAAESVELAAPEVKIGTVPGWGGTYRLATLIGPARTKQMIFTGERVPAERAERWGLVNEVVPNAGLEDRVRQLAADIAANAPISVQLAKAAIDGSAGVATGLALESIAGALAGMTEDGTEGIVAFREKRPPTFRDR